MTSTATAPAVLALVGITRRYGTLLALDDATLTLRAGTVHALLGENGAGKTTLMRIAFGLTSADAGVIYRNGVVVRMNSPSVALSAGIGMVHQHFTLVPAMTVAENVALGGRGLYSAHKAASLVQQVARRTGLSVDPHAVVHTLGVGAQQRCEIVKALARDVTVLIMDEPTALLAPDEAQELLAWLRRFADSGNAVVLITHKLRDALAVADDVTVLRRGRTVLSERRSRVSESSLVAAMLGDDGSGRADMRSAGTDAGIMRAPKTGVMHAEQVDVQDDRGIMRIRHADLTVNAGEIVGIAAIDGAGQRELLRALAGRLTVSAGRLSVSSDAGFVPEDRHRDALLLDASLAENIALRGAGQRRGLMDWGVIRARTDAIITRLDVRTTGAMSTARALSGGNQQRLVLGRELANDPEALVVENPTRGLDFRATRAVHDALRSACARGTAIVFHSSDLDEVLALSDRVYALHDGRVREVAKDRDAVGRAMLGTV